MEQYLKSTKIILNDTLLNNLTEYVYNLGLEDKTFYENNIKSLKSKMKFGYYKKIKQ